MPDRPYTTDELRALQADGEFQRRVATDEELNRLFDPPPDEPDECERTMRALGSGVTIAGVTLPPPTLGTLRVLSAVGSDFIKSERKFADLVREVTLALFVLHYGPRAVAPVTGRFRQMEAVRAYKALPSTTPDHLAKILTAERAIAEELAVFENAVTRFAGRVRLSDGETLISVAAQIDLYIKEAMSGLDLLPRVAPVDGTKKKPSPGTATMKARFSRWFGRSRRVSQSSRPDGGCHS